jgi:hypothetical protein
MDVMSKRAGNLPGFSRKVPTIDYLGDGNIVQMPGLKIADSEPPFDGRDHQLHAARYAFHKVVVTRYANEVNAGRMPVEQAREMYGLALLNYDELIESSESGSVTDSDDLDMVKGFPL